MTPNTLMGAGTPTIIVGTLGDDLSDRSLVAQAELVRSLFPGSTIVRDTSFDVAAGPAAWPTNPVLYGGAHVNGIVRALGDTLPLRAGADSIELGGTSLTGPGYRVIAAIPARTEASGGPVHPALVLYAGTGTPGIVDINNLRHGGEAIVLGDSFGRLRGGRWERDPAGAVVARLEPPGRRIGWRIVERPVAGVSMRIGFPEMLPAGEDESAIVDAIVRGLQTSVSRLQLAAPAVATVYVHPDRRSKQSLTGDSGDGHAIPLAMAVHVIRNDPRTGGPLEHLVAHEATHVLAGAAWGASASPLMGEGLAVWVSGQYAGVPLGEWARRLEDRPPAATLLPVRAFRARPEAATYPYAGLLLSAMVDQVGLAAIRDHLYGAPSDAWATACTRAGTTAARLDQALHPP